MHSKMIVCIEHWFILHHQSAISQHHKAEKVETLLNKTLDCYKEILLRDFSTSPPYTNNQGNF